MNNINPVDRYKDRAEKLSIQRIILARKKSWVSWSRLAAILLAGSAVYFLKNWNLLSAVGIAIIFVAVFLRLVVISVDVSEKMKNLDRLLLINQQEINIANHHYLDLPDGTAFFSSTHHYANDLDIFGKASLYQYINRTTSEQGNQTLANWLLKPADTTTILQRQKAAKELQPLLEWRQQLQAYGNATPLTLGTQQKVKNWIQDQNNFFRHPIWNWIRFIGPAIIMTILILYIDNQLATKWFNLALLIFFLTTGYISKKATPTYNHLSKISAEISTLSNSLKHIEDQPFKTSWMLQQQECFINKNTNASVVVKTLNGILSRLDIRLNPVAFIPLNILLFWDLQQMLAFEKWKKANQEHIIIWLNTLGKIEAMNSIATVAFNHPQWCYPEIVDQHGSFIVSELGHPLIPEYKRVNNSFTTDNLGQIAIITGSNMAGKSTFLRSVGLSLVMGMAGAPVCAKTARFSRMQVISTMRISDNLEESTSTFYAELKKLQRIIDMVDRNEKVFLLLDEILRGTNSLDRHTGSKALIQQLVKKQAVGILATHDLELAKLVEEYPANIHNYHFDVQVANEELFFDYKLKTGVCNSMNASILMKKIGIEI